MYSLLIIQELAAISLLVDCIYMVLFLCIRSWWNQYVISISCSSIFHNSMLLALDPSWHVNTVYRELPEIRAWQHITNAFYLMIITRGFTSNEDHSSGEYPRGNTSHMYFQSAWVKSSNHRTLYNQFTNHQVYDVNKICKYIQHKRV